MSEALAVPQRSSAFESRLALCLSVSIGLLVLLSALAFVALGYPWTMVGTFTDSLSYLWMADAWQHGISNPEHAVGANMLRGGRFPPGYSFYLSMFGADVSLAGMRAANIAQMSSVIAMLVIAYLVLQQQLQARLLALLGVALLMCTPGLMPWGLELVSEHLFSALLLGSCWVAANPRLESRWFWVAVLIGLACLVRTMGVVAIPALFLWLACGQRSWRRAVIACLLTAAPFLLWKLFQTLGAQTSGADYRQEFLQGLGIFAEGVPAGIWRQMQHFLLALVPSSWPAVSGLLFSGGLLIAAIAGIAARLRRFDFVAWLALLQTLLLAFWPYPEHMARLLTPLAPLLICFALLHLQRWLKGWVVGAASLVIGASLIWQFSDVSRRALALEDAELRPYLRNVASLSSPDPERSATFLHHLMRVSQRLDSEVGPQHCVLSTVPHLIGLGSRRRMLRVAADFSWSDASCDYVLAVNLRAADGSAVAMHPVAGGPPPANIARPVLISHMQNGGLVVAVLLQRVRAEAP